MYNCLRVTRYPSQLAVMQSSVWSSYIKHQLAFVFMDLGLLLVHIILRLIHWWVGVFSSQKVKVQLRPLRIPVQHDERGNTANGKEKPFFFMSVIIFYLYFRIMNIGEVSRRSVVKLVAFLALQAFRLTMHS